jgi:orotidine-5'-phosphate decarboxylase
MQGFVRSWIGVLEEYNGPFFLDLKLCDIPNTLRNVARELNDLKLPNLKYVTVLGQSGQDGVAAVVEELPSVDVLVVTVLTSQGGFDLINHGIAIEAESYARRAKQVGAAGCVCSAFEAKKIREKLGDDFIIVTPGIRLDKDDVKDDDQRRRATPAGAILCGADMVVVGRPIVNATDPVEATYKFVASIKKGLEEKK